MKKKIYILLGSSLFLIVLSMIWFTPFTKTIMIDDFSIHGKVNDEQAIKEVLECLQKNITAANSKNIDDYVDTLIPKKREDTKKEMSAFFSEYTIHTEILSFNVLKQEEDHILIQTQQKSINNGNQKYRNHIAETNHIFVKENGTWFIDQSIMTNTKFIN